LSRWPLHPFLLGAFPVLFLWSQNASEVHRGEVLPLLAVVVIAVVLLAAVVGSVLRDARRGALVASVGAVVLLSYGHVAAGLPPWLGIALAVALLAAATVFAARAGEATLGGWTRGANVIGAVLVATTLVPLTSGALASAPASAHLGDGVAITRPDEPPDIFYIVPDRYARADSLREIFDHDNREFTAALESVGFDVLDDSLANYPKTAHSLATSLNLEYLDELEGTVPASRGGDWGPVYALLRDHRLGEALTSIGYDYLHLGTWWSPTATSVNATHVLTRNRSSEFRQVFEATTAWPTLRSLFGDDAPLTRRDAHRVFGEHQLDTLDVLASQDGPAPRFVFAHLALPHEPYVFDADGSVVLEGVEKSRTREDNYVRQLTYLNQRLLAIVERIVEHNPGAIVIIQADEGPHPVQRLRQGPPYRWLEASVAELGEKLRILNAVRLPGVPDAELPEDLTPVNTFRLVLDRYFGADLDLLEDASYVFPDEDHLYTFVDVTDRLR